MAHLRAAAHHLLAFLRGVARWMRGVVGEDRYEHYLRHHATHHPDQEPMTRGEYWRWVYDDMDANPQARCC